MLNLKVGVTKNPRFEPLIDGSVKSDKANLNIHVTTPPELFFKNLKNDEFDVFEMSLSEFLITREQAKGARWQWAALPIFPAKAFVWMTLFVNTGAGIQGLCDLKGKRVGIPDYVMTAGLWFRVILRELCGIQPKDISWYIGRVQDLSHGGLLGMDSRPPARRPPRPAYRPPGSLRSKLSTSCSTKAKSTLPTDLRRVTTPS